ncbi:site-specific DNA-methyltransferase [Dethiothermospora halolimnae]|uniref:site-specific DNA-methyltransferase n=1 Tax=Dethiothermospora halolimnae TaxID=3114390 RepID=UPI003CCBABC5
MNYEDMSREDLLKEFNKLKRVQKYGLYWEEKPEDVDELLKTNYPVLTNLKEKDILQDNKSFNNVLIEGDNLHTLELLYITHYEKIKLIYIDPPYNTGNKDFIYNDKFVDKEDSWKHSKWLSFMYRRLKIARELLKDEGVIFISIDDNEFAQLKLLCNAVFDENNFVAVLPTVMNLKGNQDQFGFAGTHEYTLVYAKNKSLAKINEFDIDEEVLFDKWKEDDIGFYKKGANLKATGVNAPREKRPNLYYPIYIDNKDNIHLERKNEDDIELLPITRGKEMSWRWSKEKINNEKHNVIIVRSRNKVSLYKKQRPQIGDMPTKKPKTLFYKPEYSSGNGTGLLKEMFNGEKVFNNPKPLELIKDIIKLGSNKNDIILDFFAGSGTTAQAILEINKEQADSNRKFILATNNEKDICEKVCYPRLKKLLKGFINDKGEKINGYKENLKYFRADMVGKNKNRDQMKVIMAQKIYDLLSIKENCFNLIEEEPYYRVYKQNNKVMGIYSFFTENYMEEFKKKIRNIEAEHKVVYSFSFTNHVKKEIFEDLKGVDIKAIPSKILQILDDLRK